MKTKVSILVGGLALVSCFEVEAAPVALDTFIPQSTDAASFTGGSSTGFTLGNGIDNFDPSSRGEATFTDGAITLAEGDSLALSFNLSVTSGVDDNPSYERGFRFGFVDFDANDASVLGAFDGGPNPGGTTTRVLTNAAGNLFSTGTEAATDNNAGTAITNGNDLDISITIVRGASDLYDVTLNWDGTVFLAEDISLIGTPGTFNGVSIISNNGFDADSQLVISSVSVEYVPEPGSFALMGLGALLFVRKRYRQS